MWTCKLTEILLIFSQFVFVFPMHPNSRLANFYKSFTRDYQSCYSIKWNSDKTHFIAFIDPKTFLGDAAFDSCQLYSELLTGSTLGENKHFAKAYIPLNSRSGLENPDCKVNGNGIPCCPNDNTLPMKHEGTSTRKNGLKRYKFICPKIKYVRDASTGKYHRHCVCDNPCTTSECGRMIYVYPEKDLRAYPRTIRGTEEWDNTACRLNPCWYHTAHYSCSCRQNQTSRIHTKSEITQLLRSYQHHKAYGLLKCAQNG